MNESLGARVCAYCGSDKAGRDCLAPHSMIIAWAKEKGVMLEVPTSSYLHTKCVRRVRFHVTRAIKEGK